MTNTTAGGRTLVPYESIRDVTNGDTVRLKSGELASDYDGAGINPALRSVDVKVVNRDISDNTVLITVGDPATHRHWVKFHQLVQVVNSPAAPAPATEWVPLTDTRPLKAGDVVRVKDGERGGDNPYGGRLKDQVFEDETVIVTSVISTLQFEARGAYGGGSNLAFHPNQFEVQRPASAPLDPLELSSYRPGTEWRMVEEGVPSRWWTVKLVDENEVTEHFQGQDRANGTLSASTMRSRLAGQSCWTLALIKGGLKDAAPMEPETPAKPEMYTEEWFNGFMERALDHANDHDMCGEVEKFLESEGIDPGKLTAKTAVVDVTVTVQIEVDMSGRRAYSEGDLLHEVEKAIHSGLRNLDTSNMTDTRGVAFDSVRPGLPTVSATVAEVRAR